MTFDTHLGRRASSSRRSQSIQPVRILGDDYQPINNPSIPVTTRQPPVEGVVDPAAANDYREEGLAEGTTT